MACEVGAVAVPCGQRDGPDFAHQLLVYPSVNPPSVRWFDSYDEYATGYFLEIDSVEWYLEQYLDRAVDVANAYAFPLRARSLSGPATGRRRRWPRRPHGRGDRKSVV